MTSSALRFGSTMENSQSNTIAHQHCPYHLIRLDRTWCWMWKYCVTQILAWSQVSTTLKTGPSLGGAWHGGKDKGHPAGQYLDAFGESTLRLQNCPSFLFHHPNRCMIFRPPKKMTYPLIRWTKYWTTFPLLRLPKFQSCFASPKGKKTNGQKNHPPPNHDMSHTHTHVVWNWDVGTGVSCQSSSQGLNILSIYVIMTYLSKHEPMMFTEKACPIP